MSILHLTWSQCSDQFVCSKGRFTKNVFVSNFYEKRKYILYILEYNISYVLFGKIFFKRYDTNNICWHSCAIINEHAIGTEYTMNTSILQDLRNCYNDVCSRGFNKTLFTMSCFGLIEPNDDFLDEYVTSLHFPLYIT